MASICSYFKGLNNIFLQLKKTIFMAKRRLKIAQSRIQYLNIIGILYITIGFLVKV